MYGANTKQPFSRAPNGVDHPLTPVRRDEKPNEMMAHSYSHLFSLPTTGLRFFTVYGPWGRPDMAYFKFVQKILAGRADRCLQLRQPPPRFHLHRRYRTGRDPHLRPYRHPRPRTGGSDTPNPSTSKAPYRIYNIGNNTPVELLKFIGLIEQNLGIEGEEKSFADAAAAMCPTPLPT